MLRLFFALYPSSWAAGRIGDLAADLRLRHGLTGPAVPGGRLHISLNGLGEHDEPPHRLIAGAKAAAATVRIRPFVVGLDLVMSFLGPDGRRPLVLAGEDGVVGVYSLHARLHAALARARLVRGAEPQIMPHLTLLRDRRAVPQQEIAPVRWWVREVLLLASVTGEARHRVLGRWPLAERAEDVGAKHPGGAQPTLN